MRVWIGVLALAAIGAQACGGRASGVAPSSNAAPDVFTSTDASTVADTLSEAASGDAVAPSDAPFGSEMAAPDAESDGDAALVPEATAGGGLDAGDLDSVIAEAEQAPAVDACSPDACAPVVAAPCGTGGPVSSCVYLSAEEHGSVDVLAMAATASEIGVAWTETYAGSVHFTRFGADFSILSDSVLLGLADTSALSVAATPTGWLVAVSRTVNTLLKIDSSGHLRANRALGGAGRYVFSTVVSGPGGVSLLTWRTLAGDAFAQLVDSEGAPLGAPITAREPNGWYAAPVNDGFVLGGCSHGVDLFHLGTDGTLSAGDATTFQSDASFPPICGSTYLAATVTGIRVVYGVQNLTGRQDICFREATRNGFFVDGAVCVTQANQGIYAAPFFIAPDDSTIIPSGRTLWRWTETEAGLLNIALADLYNRTWSPAYAQQGQDIIFASVADLADVGVQEPIMLQRIHVAP